MQDLDDIETSRGPVLFCPILAMTCVPHICFLDSFHCTQIKMRKNTRQFLLRADAENLIRRGLVEHVTTNERH